MTSAVYRAFEVELLVYTEKVYFTMLNRINMNFPDRL